LTSTPPQLKNTKHFLSTKEGKSKARKHNNTIHASVFLDAT